MNRMLPAQFLIGISTIAFVASASAAPMFFADIYHGADDFANRDVVGDVDLFEIHSATVDKIGSDLIFSIDSNMDTFADGGGLGSFTGAATDTVLGEGKGVGFGDLFISTTGWTPFGAAPWNDDNHANGTVWDFGVALDDRWNDTSTTAALYSLGGATNDANAYLSDDFLAVSTSSFRNGQEVAVDTGAMDVTKIKDLADVTTVDGTVVFTIDVTGTALDGLPMTSLSFHWGMTCGNDVIEATLPEPTTIAMLVLGVACIGLSRVRRRQVTDRA